MAKLPAEFPNDDAGPRARDARRHPVAFVASIAAHALILAALVFLLPQVERPHQWVLAYLVDLGDSGGAGKGGSAGAASHSEEAPPAAMPPAPPHRHPRAAHPQATPPRASLPPPAPIAPPPAEDGFAATAASTPPHASAPDGASASAGTQIASASGIGTGLKGNGSGGFGDGSGSSFAHVEYGHNPAPVYPVEARRRAEHGTVVLRIKVAADGSVAMVEVAQTSGFDLLDDAALDAVRRGWRFVPAYRDGSAVESWVEVPIRFALTEAQAD